MLISNSPPLNPYVDLKFFITGSIIPLNHGYTLYAAICHQFPIVHDLMSLSIHPIKGKPEFPNLLHLTEDSELRLRLPDNQVPLIYRLAGKTLTLNEHRIRLGLPESRFITPYHQLYSHIVIIRGFDEPDAFLNAAQRQLAQRDIKGNIKLITKPTGEPIRRTIEIKGKTLVGYGVKITDLNEQDAISLQEEGIGGKHKMGCGVFVPVKHRRNQ